MGRREKTSQALNTTLIPQPSVTHSGHADQLCQPVAMMTQAPHTRTLMVG